MMSSSYGDSLVSWDSEWALLLRDAIQFDDDKIAASVLSQLRTEEGGERDVLHRAIRMPTVLGETIGTDAWRNIAEACSISLKRHRGTSRREDRRADAFAGGILVYMFTVTTAHHIWTGDVGIALVAMTWLVVDSNSRELRDQTARLLDQFPSCFSRRALSHHDLIEAQYGRLPRAASTVLRAFGERSRQGKTWSESVDELRTACAHFELPEIMEEWVNLIQNGNHLE